ncbi:MAG: DUF3293 domain-containing protein [Gammaproteobacteria bacterium]|jgi:hypothetical protein|nr:DUF3293 domain-containing protein [Gammaproteobacteria bacterium]
MNTHAASHSPEGLLQAFAATDYRPRVGGREFVIRAGRPHEALDTALDGKTWAVVTAFNPGARVSDGESNLARHRRLREAIAERGWANYPAVNRDPSGDWPDETSLLVVGADLDAIDAIATAFGQAAIVTGQQGEPARIRVYGTTWSQTLPDWARRAD